MKTYLLPSNRISDFITRLAEDGSVFYPVLEEDKAHFVKFDKDKKYEPNFRKIRAVENIKHFLFPSRDVVAIFPKDVHRAPEKQYLLGVKNCDLRGVEVYDRVFLNWEPTDPFYKEKRDNTIIISADCPEPEDTCFCNLVGLNPYGEAVSDINVTEVSSGCLFEVFTPHGEEVVERLKDLLKEASTEDKNDREKIRRNALQKLAQINDKSFTKDLTHRVEHADKRLKHDVRKDCVECHGCLHTCPTCYCFLLSDYKRGKDVERIRQWDACYYAAYARVGGGANPRSTLDDRFWNRFQCKFNYFQQYENIYACSGCGRCYLGCSGKIDIREILWRL